MKEIICTQGKTVFVDDEDFDRLNRFVWHVVSNSPKNENRRIYYARRWERQQDGSKKIIFMHREIMGIGNIKGIVVDHKDFNGLNNQKNNLQVITHQQNLQRKRKQQMPKKKINHRVIKTKVDPLEYKRANSILKQEELCLM